jgi:beta-phosphoglucomutase
LRVAEELGAEPADCVVFEDSPTGAEAARRAGMQAVIITTTHTAEEFAHFEHVVRIISDFEEVRVEELL